MLLPVKSGVGAWEEELFNKLHKEVLEGWEVSDRSNPIKIYAFILFKMSFWESA